jgi:tRNA(Glu) U13 pseudouridine synthase TruD
MYVSVMYQRFGIGGTPTSTIGIHILKCDWQSAVHAIMAPRDNEYSEVQAAKVYYLKNTDDPKVGNYLTCTHVLSMIVYMHMCEYTFIRVRRMSTVVQS